MLGHEMFNEPTQPLECRRCGEIVAESEEVGFCRVCFGELCQSCWNEHGKCGHGKEKEESDLSDEGRWHEPERDPNESYPVLWCDECEQDTAHKGSDHRCVICGSEHEEKIASQELPWPACTRCGSTDTERVGEGRHLCAECERTFYHRDEAEEVLTC